MSEDIKNTKEDALEFIVSLSDYLNNAIEQLNNLRELSTSNQGVVDSANYAQHVAKLTSILSEATLQRKKLEKSIEISKTIKQKQIHKKIKRLSEPVEEADTDEIVKVENTKLKIKIVDGGIIVIE